ncbi:hypothetical protein NDU88_004064 [Pleurodeles waltl]|uniref:Uncharacterized protein n=1 Tax=Pleurodeles waltl TaxID=8319 RepID=A0AAV7UEJ0_PLEWA|nr:hypothetical protein NDU88_004064 [Pleurodeles waltl]
MEVAEVSIGGAQGVVGACLGPCAVADKAGGAWGDPVPDLPAEEPSWAEILAAVQASRLEGKIETVALEVNLLRTDLRKVLDKVQVKEGSIAELELEVASLRKQVANITYKTRALEVRA